MIRVPRNDGDLRPANRPNNMLLLASTARDACQQSWPRTGREWSSLSCHRGRSCVLITDCMLAYEDYAAEGVAENDTWPAANPAGPVFDESGLDPPRSPGISSFAAIRGASRTCLHVSPRTIAYFRPRWTSGWRRKIIERRRTPALLTATHSGRLAVRAWHPRGEVISRQIAEFQGPRLGRNRGAERSRFSTANGPEEASES